MISYLTHDRIDKSHWDRCVAQACNGNVYAWSWYLDQVHPGWEALVEMDGDNYLSIMPLTCKRKYLIRYLCQPFFVQQLGVFSLHPVTAETTRSFLAAIPKKFKLVEIRLNEQNPVPEGLNGVEIHRNSLLDLNSDYDTLSSNYHDNTKRNLKKSLKCNLRVVKGVDVKSVVALFRANRGASVSHWSDLEYARLESLTTTAISSSNAFVYGIQNSSDKEIICGAIFMLSHHRITFLFSGNSEQGKAAGAMTFLIDQVIHEYAGKPMVFDFEGSDDDNLARFYSGFGAQAVTYPGYSYRRF